MNWRRSSIFEAGDKKFEKSRLSLGIRREKLCGLCRKKDKIEIAAKAGDFKLKPISETGRTEK